MGKIRKIKIIGAGGIGCYLVEPLARYLSFCGDECEITVIDGDKYEERNKERQRFSEHGNKAEHTVNLLKNEFPKIYFKFKPVFITQDNVVSSIREEDIVFMCVDNHSTRKIVSERCSELDNVSLISGGNDFTDGNVIVYLRKDGQDITRSPVDLHPKIANPDDKNPGDLDESNRQGCQRETEANPQLLFMNLAVASTMLNCYRKCEQNDVNFHQVYIDIDSLRSRPSPVLE